MALISLPLIAWQDFIEQAVNDILISTITFFWLRSYLQKTKDKSRFPKLSRYLQLVTIGLSLVMLAWGLAIHSL